MMMDFGGHRCPSLRMIVGSGLVAAALIDCGKKEPAQPAANAADSASKANTEIRPQPQKPAIDDSAIQARLDELVNSVSVEEKGGQNIQADLCCVTPEDVRKYRL